MAYPSNVRVFKPARGLNAEAVQEIVSSLRDGGLLLLPTDTVYGIAAHPLVPDGVAALFRTKQRDPGKAIALLAAGIQDVEKSGGILGSAERRLAERFWPGPLTLVIPVRGTAGRDNSSLRPYGRTEGFRIPASVVCRDVLSAAGGLLRVTSANQSGKAPARTFREAMDSVGDFVRVAVDGGKTRGGEVSTVAEIVYQGAAVEAVRILREGALSKKQLEEVAES